MSVGGIGRGKAVLRGYRPLFALATAALLLGAVLLAVSMARTGSAPRAGSPPRWQALPARGVFLQKAKAPGPAAWPAPAGSRTVSSPQDVCDPTSTATADCDGFSVGLSGATAIVAEPGIKHKAGSASVFNFVRIRISGQAVPAGWVHKATIPDPRSSNDDEYAWATAAFSTKSATYIAIGGNDNNGLPDFVYIFEGSGKTWHLQAKIPDPGNTYVDMFGDSLAISSTTLVVGASCLDNNSGAAYIYQRSGSKWVLRASIKDPLDREDDSFGQSVAVSGNNVLIGSVGEAYLYTGTSAHGWQLTTTLHNPEPQIYDFGNSVAISGATAIVGAPGGKPGSAVVVPGAAFLYKKTGARWSLAGKLTPPAGAKGDEFGYAVAMTGTNILVGMPVYGTKTSCGTAFVYKPSGNKWVLLQQLKDPSCTAGASFGFSVELAGTFAVIGAPGTNKYQGAAYEFTIK